MSSYHITRVDPSENWPNGAWSIYRITGDEIASRIVRERVNKSGWYEGGIIARHPWPGYIGMFENLEDAFKAIGRKD